MEYQIGGRAKTRNQPFNAPYWIVGRIGDTFYGVHRSERFSSVVRFTENSTEIECVAESTVDSEILCRSFWEKIKHDPDSIHTMSLEDFDGLAEGVIL